MCGLRWGGSCSVRRMVDGREGFRVGCSGVELWLLSGCYVFCLGYEAVAKVSLSGCWVVVVVSDVAAMGL